MTIVQLDDIIGSGSAEMYSIPVDESLSDLNLQVSSASDVESVSISDPTGEKKTKPIDPEMGGLIFACYNMPYDKI